MISGLRKQGHERTDGAMPGMSRRRKIMIASGIGAAAIAVLLLATETEDPQPKVFKIKQLAANATTIVSTAG